MSAPVDFGAIPAASFVVNSTTQITATCPPGTGTANVTVTAAKGVSTISTADQLSYEGPPTVTGVTFHSALDGPYVVISGSNLADATEVYFGSTSSGFYFDAADNDLVSDAPSLPSGVGAVNVTVVTPSGTSPITLADLFAEGTVVPPTVTGIGPSLGFTAGGTPVTILGAGLLAPRPSTSGTLRQPASS